MLLNSLPFLAPIAINSLTGTLSGWYTARMNNRLADLNAAVHGRNAALARQEATYARFQAARNAAEKRKETGNTIGTQRAALGASGIRVDSGTALDVIADTAQTGERDAMALLQEGDLEAWRAENRAIQQETEAQRSRLSKVNVGMVVGGSLLSGAASLGSGYYSFLHSPLAR